MTGMRPNVPKSLGVHADTGAGLDEVADHDLEILARKLVQTAAPSHKLLKKTGVPRLDADYYDPRSLADTGWAVLFGPHVTQRVKDALRPLLDHRRNQVNNDVLFKVFDGPDAYIPGETAAEWLERRSVPMSDVVPLNGVPFYVMIVASPHDIPFEFQYGLDLYWGVGRLWFSSPEEFAQYSMSVVTYEISKELSTTKQMAVYATCNEGDEATHILTEVLAKPMVYGTATNKPFGQQQGWNIVPYIEGAATKAALVDICAGKVPNGPPAIIFTGSHGMVFRSGDHRQKSQQGAIITQEWKAGGAPTRDQYFAAADLPSTPRIHGLIHILFCCYGGGWPQHDSYVLADQPPEVGPRPRVARLPQAMLADPHGGALAVVAHVDRVWSMTFDQTEHEAHVNGFQAVLERIMSGDRIGHATDRFNQHWASLSNDLSHALGRKNPNPSELKNKWLARDNTRNFVLYGDPAVRIRVGGLKSIVPASAIQSVP